jgi:hypothetical protein
VNRAHIAFAAVIGALATAGCMESARLPHQSSVGAEPALPPPTIRLLPTVHIAPAQGWPEGRRRLPRRECA